MNQVNTQHFHTPWGDLIMGAFQDRLCLCDWLNRTNRASIDARILSGLHARFVERSDDVLEEASRQLALYLGNERHHFDIPLQTVGTPFQETVWNALRQLPYGCTSSYRELAEAIGKPTAVRAVAAANGADALSIFIPCHRVIGNNRKLTGYAGGLEAKAGLLALESNTPDLFRPHR